MARKLRFFKEQMLKAGFSPSTKPEARSDIDVDDLEVHHLLSRNAFFILFLYSIFFSLLCARWNLENLRRSWLKWMQMVKNCNVVIMSWLSISLFCKRYGFVCCLNQMTFVMVFFLVPTDFYIMRNSNINMAIKVANFCNKRLYMFGWVKHFGVDTLGY